MNNSWVVDSGVADALRGLNDSVGEYKKHRNLHVHRGNQPDIGAILKSDNYDHIRLNTFLAQYDPDIIAPWLLKANWRTEMSRLTATLDAEIEDVITHCSRLFDILYPVYTATSKVIKERGWSAGGVLPTS